MWFRTIVRIRKLRPWVEGGQGRWRAVEVARHRPPPSFTALHRLNFHRISHVYRPERMPPAEPVAAVPSPTDAALIAAWQGGDQQATAEPRRLHTRTLARVLAGAGAPEEDLDCLEA